LNVVKRDGLKIPVNVLHALWQRHFKPAFAATPNAVFRLTPADFVGGACRGPRPDNVINLMEALRQSLGKKAAGSTSKGRPATNQAQPQGC
jgi:hypothetical protein